MNTEPLVSAIIIFLDEEKYLEEAIESVFAQTYPNWELLLCDDGSSDGSTEIAQRCAERFPDKVRYLEHEGHQNRGMSATRNLGIRHAKGEYIAWLDGDDVWLPHNLQRQVEIMGEHPEAAMVYGPYEEWHSWTGNPDDYWRDRKQDIGVPPDTLVTPPRLTTLVLQEDVDYVPSGALVRRTILEEVGGFEEPFADRYEDDIVHAKIGLKWPVFVSGECWYRYRRHEESYCATAKGGLSERSERLIYLDKLADYLRADGHDNGEVWQVVQDKIRVSKAPSRSWTIGVRALQLTRRVAERTLPEHFRNPLAVHWYGRDGAPPPGWVHFGGLRRLTPFSRLLGADRGQPVDRYYTEQFLAAYASDIRGCVLELDTPAFTRKFGGDRVTHSEVLCARGGNPHSTVIGDLCSGEGIPANAFDCILLTHVLPSVWDFRAAIAHAACALKPGGVMLVTLPGISQLSRSHVDGRGEFWRFTSLSTRRLFEEHFAPEDMEVAAYGNVLTAASLLHGVSGDELSPAELDYRDPDYEVLITVRAVKPIAAESVKS